MQASPVRHHPTEAPQPGQRVLLGLGIAAFGTLALLDNLRIFDVALLRTCWPLALVLFGLARLAWPGNRGSRLSGVAMVLVGTMLTAQNLGSDVFALRHWWPVFVIMGGLFMLRRDTRATTQSQGDRIATDASFSNLRQQSDSANFQGGRSAAKRC